MGELNHLHENISGIYNYCDRWCEKCNFTNRCLQFKREAERNIKHILKDEDPNNPEVIKNDIKESFNEVFTFLANKETENLFDDETDEDINDLFDADEDNEDFENFFDEINQEVSEQQHHLNKSTNSDNQIIQLTDKLFKDFYSYYDQLKQKHPDDLESNSIYKPLNTVLDILGWYTPQIYVKTRMCVSSKKKLERSLSNLIREVEEEIFNVNCRIAFTGIEKCIVSINDLSNLDSDNHPQILNLIVLLDSIKKIFIQEFPAALTYKRPYFD